MGKDQDQIAFLNDGLDPRSEYTFYAKRDFLYVSFYVGNTRRQKACSLECPEVVTPAFRAQARAVAQEIIANGLSGRVVEIDPDVDRVRVASTLEELVEKWKLEQVPKYPSSFKTRHIQINNIVATAVKLELGLTPLQAILDDRGPQLFLDARMRQVAKETVKKEVGILFHFLEWLVFNKYATQVPTRPKYRKKDRGTRVGPQRAAPVHLPDDVALRIINELPEYAHRGGRPDGESRLPASAFVCRDWMRFSFETSLRPSTVGRLEVGKHWVRGRRYITITPDIDKGGNAALEGKPRNVPLTKVAFDILMKRAPTTGIIFGRHDIRVQWKRAAIAVLGQELGEKCAPYDLRHAANFRMRSTVGGSVGGAMHMAGHALATTNDAYMTSSEEEAKLVVERLDARNVELDRKRPKRASRRSTA